MAKICLHHLSNLIQEQKKFSWAFEILHDQNRMKRYPTARQFPKQYESHLGTEIQVSTCSLQNTQQTHADMERPTSPRGPQHTHSSSYCCTLYAPPAALKHLAMKCDEHARNVIVMAEAFAKINGKTMLCECMINHAIEFLRENGKRVKNSTCDWSCNVMEQNPGSQS